MLLQIINSFAIVLSHEKSSETTCVIFPFRNSIIRLDIFGTKLSSKSNVFSLPITSLIPPTFEPTTLAPHFKGQRIF